MLNLEVPLLVKVLFITKKKIYFIFLQYNHMIVGFGMRKIWLGNHLFHDQDPVMVKKMDTLIYTNGMK